MLTKLFYSHNAVTDDRAHGNLFTAESDNLCSLLSQECYLFFSLGSRLSFLGFRNAEVAYTSSSVSKQSEYIAAASKYLREAAKYWHSPSYVIGQGFSLEKKGMFNDSKNAYYAYNSLAVCAIENDTPLARATFVLLQINDIVGLVELCFNCAKNFEIKKSSMISRVASNDEPSPINMLPWEVNLYHAQFNENDDAYSFGYVHGGGTKHTDSKDDNDFVKRTCYALLYYHIGKLLESGTQHPHDSTLADQIISISMSSTDLLFLHGLYAYLFTSGNVDTLLRLDSISLENWLSKNDDAYHLLWRYYTFHNIHWMAGEVMWTRATVAGGENPIEERVECLTKSLGSYSMALRELRSETTMLQRAITSTNLSAEHCLTFKYGNSPSSDELNRAISEIGELIDVAKIQTRVLSVIMSSPNSQNIDEAQLDELKTSLLDVSKIYNEFSAPLGLYDICLAVLQTCNHDDSATISKLWRSIICEELLPCRTRSLSVQNFLLGLQKDSMLEQESVILSKTPIKKENGETLMTFEDGVWIVNVKSRIVGLGRELLGKSMDSFFPTYFIAECLEGLRQVYIESTGIKTNIWSVEILIESGASFPLTLDAYHNIYICQGGKADNNLKLEVLFAIAEILNLWLVASSSQTESTMSMHDSASVLLARYAGNILKQIDNYKSELESFISANPGEISKCYALFDDIEGSLRHKK
jgi:nuclear pore complex protein Nup155